MALHHTLPQVLTRRHLLACCTGLASLALLAACGERSSATSVSTSQEESTALLPAHASTQTIIRTAAVSRTPQAAQVTVTFTSPGGQVEDAAFQPVFAAFAKRYPNIAGLYRPYNTGYTSEYDNKLLTALAGDVGPDCFKVWPAQYFGALAAKGTLVTLDPYIARDPSIDLPDFFPEHLAACKFNGKYYALPNDGAPMAMWYNVDLFKKYGVGLPTWSWTWDDLLTAARTLTQSANGRYIQFGLGRPDWLSWVWSNGGEVLDPTGTTCLLNRPSAVAALQWIQDRALKDHVIPSPGDLQTVNASQLFMTGRLATSFGVRGDLGTYKSIQNSHFDAAPLPKSPHTGKRVASLGIGYTSLWTGSKHPEQAFTLAAWIASPTGEKLRISTGFAYPSRKSLVDQDWLARYRAPMAASYAINTVFTEELKHGEARAWTPTAKDQQILIAINSELSYLWDGSKSAKEMADVIVQKVNAVLHS